MRSRRSLLPSLPESTAQGPLRNDRALIQIPLFQKAARVGRQFLLLFDVRSQLSFAVSLFSLLLIRFAHTALSHSDLLAPFGRLPFSSGLYLRCRLVPGRN